MTIENTAHLSLQQLQDLQELRRCCQLIDGSTPNLYLHILAKPRALPASFFYYEQDQLLGFATAFFFYETTAEVALLVHPKARRRGIAKRLLQTLLPLVQLQDYNKLLFSSPAGLHSDWLSKNKLIYQHTEYYMERTGNTPLPQQSSYLSFRKAQLTDLEQLCLIDARAFHKQDINRRRFEELLSVFSEEEYTLIVVLEHEQVVGKAHMRWQSDKVTLSDIAIIPERQGSGLGTALISYCINLALEKGCHCVNLDVETHNQRALALYTRLGFQTKNTLDYWSILLTQLLSTI
jgi:ribosomal protein S18 acetylase RimI-like enzyme